MTLARNVNTGLIRDLPDNVLNHRVLGKNWVEHDPEGEYEVDKTTIGKKVFDVARPVKAKADTESKPAEAEETELNYTYLAGED